MKDREGIEISDQTRYIYKKIEIDSLVNVETMSQEIVEYRLHKEMIVRREIHISVCL